MMFTRAFVLLSLLLSTPAFAASEAKDLGTFDVYLAPFIAPTYGKYKAGSVDKGTTLSGQYGARLGFKVGPLLLGGEFGGGLISTNSKQAELSSADQQKYSADGSGTMLLVGVHAGFITNRLVFLATYYPGIDYKAEIESGASKISTKYEGKGYGAEIDFKVHNRLYVGVYATTREFNEYSSGALENAVLEPKIESLSYGLMITYFVAFSDIGSVPKLFQKF